VGGLTEDDARLLLESVLPGPLDARVRDRVIAETHGNPLALLELPRGLTPAQLTGGFGGQQRGYRWTAERGEFRAAAGGVASADPAAGAAGGRRSDRRSGAGVAGGRAARDRRRGGGTGGGGGAGRVRREGPVPASARALGGLPVGIGPDEAGTARRAGRGQPTRQSILTGGPGTVPRPRRAQMSKLPPNLSSAQAGHSAAVVSRRRPRFWSGPPG